MIKMKNIVEAVAKSNWAIFLKESNYMKDVSGLTGNTTQLLLYKKKKSCDSKEVLKMWSKSVPRVMVLSCLFCMTLLKLVKTTVGNFLSQKSVLHITTAEVKQGTRGGADQRVPLVASLDSDTQPAAARQVEVTIDLFWLLWKCKRFLFLSSFTPLIILKESMVYRQGSLWRKLCDWTWGDNARTWLQYHRISTGRLFGLY